MKLRMEIPVRNRSKVKVKVTKIMKTTVWDITFEPDVVETSGWFQNVPDRIILAPMMYDVPGFLRHVTSNTKYDFCMFSKFVNVAPIDLKIGTHIDRTYTIYLAKKMHW